MKILIVDDELPARNRLLNLLKSKSEVKTIEEAASGLQAIELINSYHPDLIFLDINLNDMTAFDVLNKVNLTEKPVIIFVSAYDSFAIEAFNYQGKDFLLKPFKEERFEKSFQYALEQSKAQKDIHFQEGLKRLILSQQNKKVVSNLPVTIGNKTLFVQTKDIKYILADRYYAEIITSTKTHVMRQSLNNLMDLLDEESFVRIHRSTIVSKVFIQEIIHSDYSEIDIKMLDGKSFRVSRSKKKEVLEFLGL